MDDAPVALPLPAPEAPEPARPVALTRGRALLEAVLVSGIPTQIVLAFLLVLLTPLRPLEDDHFSLPFFATISLLDTAAIIGLVWTFLALSHEQPADVFLGRRPVRGEIWRGLALVPVVYLLVAGIVVGLRFAAPWMRTVPTNPLEAFMRSPVDAGIFIVVVVLAGGVREELQRAFILHRFEQRLGGVKVGLAIFSIVFGALHIDQGADVAVAVGLLGLIWGITYVRRRSAVLPMVNHGAFNALQVLQGLLAKSLGG